MAAELLPRRLRITSTAAGSAATIQSDNLLVDRRTNGLARQESQSAFSGPAVGLEGSLTPLRTALWGCIMAVQDQEFRVIRREWRCTQCGKLMGITSGRRVHIRFQQGHEYMATVPVTGTCRQCGTLNDFPGAAHELSAS